MTIMMLAGKMMEESIAKDMQTGSYEYNTVQQQDYMHTLKCVNRPWLKLTIAGTTRG